MDQTNSKEDIQPAQPAGQNADIIVYDGVYTKTNPESSHHTAKEKQDSEQDMLDAAAANQEIPEPPHFEITSGNTEAPDELMLTEDTPKLISISTLTLEQKKELVDKYNHLDYVKVGTYVDAHDTTNSYLLARVVDIDNSGMAQVTFDGWSQKWNSWFRLKGIKIMPYRTQIEGYTGQKKVAIRNDMDFEFSTLVKHHTKVLKLVEQNLEGLTAFETTQYIRGELFVYVDFLLGNSFTEQEVLTEVENFIKSVLRLIVVWLNKLPTLQSTFEELEKVPNLFLVDPLAAIVKSCPELMETLSKLFGCCLRALKFFSFYDVNQETPLFISKQVKDSGVQVGQNSYGVVVRDMVDIDFENMREKNEANYNPESARVRVYEKRDIEFGYILNWVQYFAELGGFDAIFNVLSMGLNDEKAVKAPFSIISYITRPFKNLNLMLTPEFAKLFSSRVSELTVQRLQNMSEKEVKNCSKEQVENVLFYLNQILSIGMTENERSWVIETTELNIALRFLKSTNLEKRLKGLQDIKTMVERVLKTHRSNKIQQKITNWKSINDAENEYNKLPETGYLNITLMYKWLKDNKVIETIVGEGAHLEIVKRSESILSFVAKYTEEGKLDGQTVDLIWRCQQGKHEEMVRIVFNLIEQVLPSLKIQAVDLFFAKVEQTKVFDEKFLLFLRKFTIVAFDKQYNYLEKQWELNQDSTTIDVDATTNFEAYLDENENKFIDEISKHVEIQDHNTESQYGMPLFWKLCLDSSDETKEKKMLALNCLTDMFAQKINKTNRLTYLALAVNQLMNGKSLIQSCQVIKLAIESYTLDFNRRSTVENIDFSITKRLQQKINIVGIVINALRGYHELVRQKMKSLDSIGNIYEQVFVGYSSHEQTIQALLQLLEYILLSSNDAVNLGEHNIRLLWQIFVEDPNYTQEQTLFLNWINNHPSEELTSKMSVARNEMFNAEEREFLFSEILCNSVTNSNSSLSLAKCFSYYFKQINKRSGAIKVVKKTTKTANFNSLKGLKSLWEISLKAENAKAREHCQGVLVDIHLKLQEPDNLVTIEFVNTCMNNSKNEGVISLLSLFMDRYEGKKDLKPEMSLVSRVQGIKPIALQVHNLMDIQNQSQKTVHMSYYQTLGYLRQIIAEQFGLQQNEFHMIIKNSIIDADTEDDKYMKDVPGMFTTVQMKLNQAYNPLQHPKYLISNNQDYFERIFAMLQTSSQANADKVWDLIQKLPVNQYLLQCFQTLEPMEQSNTAWSELLDPKSIFKLHYCLKIVNAQISNDIDAQWIQKFIRLGGFDHMVLCLIKLQLNSVDSMLTLKCLGDLISIVQIIIKQSPNLAQNLPIKDLVHRLIDYIEMICDFSIKSEKSRGESFEQVTKRIEQARLRKSRVKMLMSGNKADSKKNDDQDNDLDSEDKKLHLSLLKQFREQTEVVNNLFNFLNQVFHQDQLAGQEALKQQPNLASLLKKGMLESENILIRNCVCCRIVDLLYPSNLHQQSQHVVEYKLVVIQLELQMVRHTLEFELRCIDFFKHLSNLMTLTSALDFQHLREEATNLINHLVQIIITREIKESTTQDKDWLLQGTIMLLSGLLQKFPDQKLIVGKKIVQYLLKDCLFEIPHGNKGDQKNCAPKCKSISSRQYALNLLNVLSRDCLENLKEVLEYLQHFNREATWRTKKEHDWSIKLYDDEKSSTGRVGIKNLGCICYMNSLNQQLFMIPSFRNDILSIQDPNHNKNTDEDNMFLQWQSLFSGLLLSEKMYCNPKGYCHAFKDWEGNPINVFEQMDVEEYLAMFLDRLESAIKDTPQAKTIQYHFGGQFANEIICKTCPHQYDRAEQFLYMGVPVKNKKSIYEGLDAFVQGDMLDEGNQYQCEKCDKKVDALKRTCIKTLPRYLILTLKRFEFDFDQMIRVKVNDLYEFPTDLDMTKYTQEYLNKVAKGGEFKLKYPVDYYNFELVGIVVHSGTADSGHYYSYIKEQEHFSEATGEQWFEFNDIWVREFDKNDLAQECYGGEETMSFGNWQGKTMMKFRSAYLVVYKRKLEEIPPDSDEEVEKTIIRKNPKLGQLNLQLEHESEMFKKIKNKNHKYWQNRYIFSSEYTEFVCQMILNWNTNNVIVANSTSRNDDQHLFQLMNTLITQQQIVTQNLPIVLDAKVPLHKFYSNLDIAFNQLSVFKFAAAHYINVMQRADDKTHLPTMVRYLKAYMNEDSDCAIWFLQQFINNDIIKECFLENMNKIMRSILVGLIYCAMIRVYKKEKFLLNDFWTDNSDGQQFPRQTTIGSLILSILTALPTLKKYNSHQAQILQILSRFASLGPEARAFLIQAQTLERLLNYFYWECSPYIQLFQNAPQLPFFYNLQPEIGLPTPEGQIKKTTFAMLKEQNRLKRLQTDDPHHQYLVETVGYLARCLNNSQSIPTRYMLDQTDFVIGDRDQVLFLPSHEFMEKIFHAATKPRLAHTICKAYMHHAIADDSLVVKLWESVKYGLNEYEHHKIRPYLILFQYLIEAAQESQFIASQVDQWLTDFFRKIVAQNQRFYQWMEVVFDFIWKMYTRVPFAKQWFQHRHEVWEFIGDWLDKNREPPVQYANQPNIPYRMNKSRAGQLNQQRYDKQRNLVLYYYRQTVLNQMRNNNPVDLSQEIDLDAVCVQDYKFQAGQLVDVLEDRFSLITTQAAISVDLDEIVQIRFQNDAGQEQTQWILTQKCKIFPAGVIQTLYKYKEMNRILLVLQKKAELEAQQKAKAEEEQRARAQISGQTNWYNRGHNVQGGSDDDEEDDEDYVENSQGNQPYARNGGQANAGNQSNRVGQPQDHTSSSAPASQPNQGAVTPQAQQVHFQADNDDANSMDPEFDVNMGHNLSSDGDFDSAHSAGNISD